MENEKRAQQGLLFKPSQKGRTKDREYHLKLMEEYNKLSLTEYQEKEILLKKMLGDLGDGSMIEPPFHANWGGKNLFVGYGTYINFNLSLVDDGKITIGNNVLIGPNVSINTVNHPISVSLRKKNYLYTREVKIADNVWIGSNVIILPGITIGENSVVGAGSVVTHNIPSNVIAVGNPCKVLREIDAHDDVYYYKNDKIDWENIK